MTDTWITEGNYELIKVARNGPTICIRSKDYGDILLFSEDDAKRLVEQLLSCLNA
jgi:hypothetical protein